jgi:hypothetical protein
VVLAATVAASRPARADVVPEPLGLPVPRRARTQEVVIDIPGERTKNNKIMLASIVGAAAVIGVVGLYFQLDWQSARNDVAASLPTGEAWTASHDELVARAERSSTRMGVAYGIGGAVLLGAAITYIATDPKSTQQVIQPSRATASTVPRERTVARERLVPLIVAPTPGGAFVGRTWRF